MQLKQYALTDVCCLRHLHL